MMHRFWASWPNQLLVALLVGDGLFFVLHGLAVAALLSSRRYFLNYDGGYAEWFQYLKFADLVLLLTWLFIHRRALVDLHWAALALFFALDDGLRLHEQAGLWLANRLSLPGLLAARPRDLGELLFFTIAGLLFLLTLLLTYRLSSSRARRFSLLLFGPLLALAACGIAADLGQELVSHLSWTESFIFLEDGGELLAVSVLAWLVVGEAAAHGLKRPHIPPRFLPVVRGAAVFFLLAAVMAFLQFSTPGLAGAGGRRPVGGVVVARARRSSRRLGRGAGAAASI